MQHITNPVPDVEVPVDPELAQEPAKVIGDLFADQKLIRPFIAAVVAVIATATGWVADTAVIDNLTTIVTTISVIYAVWSAQQEASRRAHAQAAATREVVFAPATVEDVARKAASSGNVNVTDTTVTKESVAANTGTV